MEYDEIPEIEIEEESDSSEIETILDQGYAQLDGFVSWLEEERGVPTRTAQQDCYNAEMLIDYLANQHRKRADEVNEFELRWFLFSSYIRKAQADSQTEERAPYSLSSFYDFLSTTQKYQLPSWLHETIDDIGYYARRRREYAALDPEDEIRWKTGFAIWCKELEEDLDIRGLLVPREIGLGMVWGDEMGWREATLYEEVNRLWQTERLLLLAEGNSYEELGQQLLLLYEEWINTPQEKLDGFTPIMVIQDERMNSALQPQDDDEEDEEE